MEVITSKWHTLSVNDAKLVTLINKLNVLERVKIWFIYSYIFGGDTDSIHKSHQFADLCFRFDANTFTTPL